MFRGDWGSYVAVGLILGVGLTLVLVTWLEFSCGPVCQSYFYTGTLEQDKERPQVQQLDPRGSVPVESNIAKKNPNDPEYYTYEDLKAQQSMARSTAAIVKLTVASILLGVIGSIAIILTLLQTNRAIAITREMGEMELRAYVQYAGCQYRSHPYQDNQKRHFWRIRPIIENIGITPTRRLRLVHNHRLADSALPADFSFNFERTPHNAAIGGKAGIALLPPIDIADEDLELVKHGKKHLAIWGEASYRNAINPMSRHITRFAVIVDGIAGEPMQLFDRDTNPVDLMFRNVPDHTCTDEDCQA